MKAIVEGLLFLSGEDGLTLEEISNVIEKDIDTTFPIYSLYAVGEENTEKLEQKLGKEGVRVTKRLQIGSTIGCHIGPGAYGVIFVTKK